MATLLYWLGVLIGVASIAFIIAGFVKLFSSRNATQAHIRDVAILITFGGVLYALASFVMTIGTHYK